MASLFDLLQAGQIPQGGASPDIDALVARLMGQQGIVNQPGIPVPAPNPDTVAPAAAAVQPAPMAPRAAPQFPEPTFGDQFRSGGLVGMLESALGQRTAPSRQVDAQNETYAALIKKRVEPEIAAAAVRNPELLKMTLMQAFAPKLSKIGPNEALVNGEGKEVYRNQDKLINVPEGGSLYNPNTGLMVAGGTPKPPQGFEWIDPQDRSKGLRAIPGGPGEHIPEGAAGRLALMETARKGVKDARSVYERSWGVGDLARQGAANLPYVGDLAIASGDVGIAQRNIRVAVESALRTMTGAAAPEPEVVRYAAMFTPGAKDTVASAKQKLDALDNFMDRAAKLVTQGRSSTPQGSASANDPLGIR